MCNSVALTQPEICMRNIKPTAHETDSSIAITSVIAIVWTDPFNHFNQMEILNISTSTVFIHLDIFGTKFNKLVVITQPADPPLLCVMKLPCFERRNAPVMIAYCCPVTSLHQRQLYPVTSPALLPRLLWNTGVSSNPRALVLNTPNVHFIVTP